MARRYHLHIDVNEADALKIRDAAKIGGLRPSLYVIDRVLRVADYELAVHRDQNPSKEKPEDIDTVADQQAASGGGTVGGGVTKFEEADETAEAYRARRAR